VAERIQVVLARAGVASRRKSEDLVRQGRVTVNGKVVKEPGSPVSFGKDDIRVDGRPVRHLESTITLILNKPKGVVTTARDPQGRPTVTGLVARLKKRLFPIGRLDYDTEGLLLLTNDGSLAQSLQHPRYGVEKVYKVKIKGRPDYYVLKRLCEGVILDGKKTAPARVKKIGTTKEHTWIEIAIHEGRNRQIRRMCKAVGHPALKLKRIGYGPLKLGDLKVGSFRKLTAREIALLKEAAKSVKPKNP
jgi:23S rRNA pseudouridine2605 synthase